MSNGEKNNEDCNVGRVQADDGRLPVAIHIRAFHPECPQDRKGIMSLVRELQSHELGLFDRMKPPDEIEDDPYLQYLCDECESQDGYVLLAEQQRNPPEASIENNQETPSTTTTIVGYAVVLSRVSNNSDRSIEEVPYEYGELLELAVAETCRGLGIGQKLFEAGEQKVRDAGAKYFRTSVLASNEQAHKLYERFGFSDHLVEMEKRLNDWTAYAIELLYLRARGVLL